MLNYLFIILIVILLILQSKIHNQWIDSYNKQNGLLQDIVSNHEILLKGEERKFELGESSIFLVNSREKSLIDARLKGNKLENSFFKTKAKLFKSIGINPVLN